MAVCESTTYTFCDVCLLCWHETTYVAECSLSSFVLEKTGSHTPKGTVESSRISGNQSGVLAKLEDNTGFLETGASAVWTFSLLP